MIYIPVSSHFLFSKDQKLGKTVWRRVAHTCVTRVTATDTAVLPAVRTHLIVLLETLASAVPVQTFLNTWQSICEPSLHYILDAFSLLLSIPHTFNSALFMFNFGKLDSEFWWQESNQSSDVHTVHETHVVLVGTYLTKWV